MSNLRKNICNFAPLRQKNMYNMRKKHIIQLAKEIKYLFYVLIFAFFSGLIGYGVGKKYEKALLTKYCEAQKHWENYQDSVQEAHRNYAAEKRYKERQEIKKRKETIIIKKLEEYIYNNYLRRDFDNYCKKNNFDKNKHIAIYSYISDGLKNNKFYDSDIIQLRSLLQESINIYKDDFDTYEYTDNLNSTTRSYLSFNYFKENRVPNLPILIRKYSPQELWLLTSISIIILYIGIRFLMLLFKAGKWINKTSKLDIE